MKDIAAQIKIVNATTAPSVTTDTDYASVDLVDFNGCAIQLDFGTIVGAGSVIPVIQVSDDNSTWTTCPVAELDEAPTLVELADADTAQKFNYAGEARYLRAQADVTGTIDVKTNVTYVLGAPRHMPVEA